ncbi:MAG TPA: fumarylacetoacetate hydrolase family protein [Terracidiphilus sp.]|nr:fumarylacetoacetate hydrolase family protein [Terracidiphilus sp.]
MKLLNFFNAAGLRSMGLVEDDRVFDLSSAARGNAAFASVGQWLRAGDSAREQIKSLRDDLVQNLAAATPLGELRHAPLVELDARIFCVGLNYADHAAENNLPPPDSPIFFAKLASVVVPHGTAVPLPAASQKVDYEAELAVVIGRDADRVSETEAAQCMAGYTIMNDVSARDMQRLDKQWFRGKNCNGFGPMGPWMVTADAVPDPGNLSVQLRVNGEQRQNSNTSNLVFGPAALISILSQTLALKPGDVISTGTPAGIGGARKPPVFLQPGDRVEVKVAGIGILANTFIAQPPKSRTATP